MYDYEPNDALAAAQGVLFALLIALCLIATIAAILLAVVLA
jgi:hypothetical protein